MSGLRGSRVTFALACALLLVPTQSAFSQATPSSRFIWTQTASSLQDAQSFVYRVYIDNSPTGITLPASCVALPAPSQFDCTAPIPAVTSGAHSVTFSAANAAGEGPMSAPFNFTMLAPPGPPSNVRIAS